MSNSQDRAMSKGTALARLGALCYVLWGLVHYNAAYGLFQLAGTAPVSMVRGRLQQDGFYLAGLATIGIVVGVWLNWRNDRVGFWMNAVAVSLGDIPFVFFCFAASMMQDCIRLCNECLELCRTCVALLTGSSGFAHRVCGICSELCTACASECGKYDGETMKKCAQACRQCAATCAEVAQGGPIRRAAA